MLKLAGPLNRYPARVTSLGFAILIVIGTLMLYAPWACADKTRPISLVDSLFMATSSVCVTGLSVRSLIDDFSFLGQLSVLLLIQVGGLGIMTLTTFVLLASGERGGLRHHLLITSTVAGQSKADLKIVLQRIFLLTAVCELAGFAILFLRFLSLMPLGSALWNSFFLSISSFCNAGFALDNQSLILYQNDPVVLGVISGLIIIGGIGYPVLFDLAGRHRRSGFNGLWDDLHIHSKLIILGTIALLVGGFFAILVLEWNNPNASDQSLYTRAMIAGFQSVTCRTAGYNSVDLTTFGNATLIVIMILMLIGAGPCSTAGGMKVTTFFMIIIHAYSRFRGRPNVTVFRRTIPAIAIDRAIATAILFFTVATFGSVLMLSIEQIGQTRETQRIQFLQIIFEVVSALGTVGLSINETWNLTPLSKIVLVLLMFVGRLGPIAFFAALSTSSSKSRIQYASEEPITG